ncbi:hypothetical protein SynSYN20_02911 [Synechococcus sp. SYN20]|nr:hypothetical protein SynSYN20_02911 [Synechococcus sp. SYN20]
MSTSEQHGLSCAQVKKKTPQKAGSLGFLLGVLPCLHSVKKFSSRIADASEIGLGKSLRIS